MSTPAITPPDRSIGPFGRTGVLANQNAMRDVQMGRNPDDQETPEPTPLTKPPRVNATPRYGLGARSEAAQKKIHADIDKLSREMKPLPSYKDGVDFVPETGPAIVHKGEKITPAKENKMAKKWSDEIESGERKAAPKKEIKEIRVRKTANGKHIAVHTHHRPEHHRDEEHGINSLDDLTKHFADHNDAMTAAPSPEEMGGAAPEAAAAQPPAAAGPGGPQAPAM
jgi:hypothetical protein